MITHASFKKSVFKCMGISGNHGSLNLGKVAVAISGGVDSMCLAFMLSQYKKLFEPGMDIIGITIDHRYRLNSEEEAEKVGSIVQKWGLKHIVVPLEYDTDVTQISNFEEVARTKRYEIFDAVCREREIGNIFVGHNLDDQIETFLHRLLRNSSIFGLVGLKQRSRLPVATKGPFGKQIFTMRPLLDFSKSDIIETCTSNKIPWFEDVTNKDIHLTRRNLLRHVLNELEQIEDTSGMFKAELVATIEEVKTLADLMRIKASNLGSFLQEREWIEYNSKNGCLTLKLPSQLFIGENKLIVSQLLFELLQPISSVKYYYWSYAKLERHLVPRVAKYLEDPSSRGPLKLTYLNLVFEVNRINTTHIQVSIQRQPSLRYQDRSLSLRVNSSWSSWQLFDNRFWIRAKLEGTCLSIDDTITIAIYNHKSFQNKLHPNLNGKIALGRDMEGAPVILHNSQIVSFPSYGIQLDGLIETNCHLKS